MNIFNVLGTFFQPGRRPVLIVLPAFADAKPVSLKSTGPSAAAAAAAARHEVQVTQLEGQLAAHQRDLQTARGDLQHAARCFDAAMVMVNYISKEVGFEALQTVVFVRFACVEDVDLVLCSPLC